MGWDAATAEAVSPVTGWSCPGGLVTVSEVAPMAGEQLLVRARLRASVAVPWAAGQRQV